MSGQNAKVAAEIYLAFDFRSAAAGRLDSLFERHADPELELEPPPIYPDMSVYRGLEAIKGSGPSSRGRRARASTSGASATGRS